MTAPKSEAELLAIVGLSPPEVDGVTDGLVEWVKPRRLSVFGQTAIEAAVREVSDDPGFGRWLFGRREWRLLFHREPDDDLAALFEYVDHWQDPYSSSINDLKCALHEPDFHDCLDSECECCPCCLEPEACSCDCRDEEALTYGDISFDEVVDLRAFFGEWSFKFLRERLAARGLKLRKHRDLAHVCALEFTPLDPPDVSGLYFVRCHDRLKIGIAPVGTIKRRVAGQRDRSFQAFPLELIAYVPGWGACEERELHQRFAHLRVDDVRGREWFAFVDDLRDFVADIRRGMRARGIR